MVGRIQNRAPASRRTRRACVPNEDGADSCSCTPVCSMTGAPRPAREDTRDGDHAPDAGQWDTPRRTTIGASRRYAARRREGSWPGRDGVGGGDVAEGREEEEEEEDLEGARHHHRQEGVVPGGARAGDKEEEEEERGGAAAEEEEGGAGASASARARGRRPRRRAMCVCVVWVVSYVSV